PPGGEARPLDIAVLAINGDRLRLDEKLGDTLQQIRIEVGLLAETHGVGPIRIAVGLGRDPTGQQHAGDRSIPVTAVGGAILVWPVLPKFVRWQGRLLLDEPLNAGGEPGHGRSRAQGHAVFTTARYDPLNGKMPQVRHPSGRRTRQDQPSKRLPSGSTWSKRNSRNWSRANREPSSV